MGCLFCTATRPGFKRCKKIVTRILCQLFKVNPRVCPIKSYRCTALLAANSIAENGAFCLFFASNSVKSFGFSWAPPNFAPITFGAGQTCTSTRLCPTRSVIGALLCCNCCMPIIPFLLENTKDILYWMVMDRIPVYLISVILLDFLLPLHYETTKTKRASEIKVGLCFMNIFPVLYTFCKDF